MVGVLITFVFAIGAMGVGQFLVGRWTREQDPAEAIGVHGLVGLGGLGLLTLGVGLLPGGLKWGLGVVGLAALAGFIPVIKSFGEGRFKIEKPQGATLLFLFAIGIAFVFALVGALAPSDTLDWDTLAYHLAVPKLWMQAGQIQYIPFIHHSNFPSTVEGLFIWGLTWGGQSGAKAFTLTFLLSGLIAIFGLARSRYGGIAGWWAALTFVTVPVVAWESGTGYIDVPHGLYGGLGILFAARFILNSEARANLFLSAVFLGFAAGTKYTGLQTIGVVCFVLALSFALQKKAGGLKSAALVGLVAMAIAGPWYVKTVVLTGNPVFPFFYEHLGGKGWDQRRADVYRNEQQNFGAGTIETRHKPTQIGNAVLGLAYQPGRYVNPDEKHGNGTPLGAIGIVVIAAALLWAVCGRAKPFESSVLSVVGISMLMWFFLSEQSRYVVPLCVPLAVLAGGYIERIKIGKLLMGAVIAQAAYSLYLVYSQRFVLQSQVAFGKVSPEDYQTQFVGFYEASQGINKEAGTGKVALYDEVFGYLLDVPYVWANPPHSLMIPYDTLNTGEAYADSMKKLGFSHIYISTSPLVKDPAFVTQWVAAMGLVKAPEPWTGTMRADLLGNWENKWMVLFADAVAAKRIVPVKGFKRGILFSIP